MPNYLNDDELAHAKGLLDRMTTIYQHTVVGQEALRRALTASLLAGGHVLGGVRARPARRRRPRRPSRPRCRAPSIAFSVLPT